MKNEVISNKTIDKSNIHPKHISKVIIRLELDDINLQNIKTVDKTYDLTSFEQIKETFTYNSDFKPIKPINFPKESLNQFIGRRESRFLIIETYNFEKMLKPNSLDGSDVETNSMTMQTALETAYSDWKKEKKTSELIVENTDQLNDKIKPVVVQEELSTNKNDNRITELSFYYGNPTIDIVKGFMHIYRDKDLTPLEISESSKLASSSTVTISNTVHQSELLCMISIPAKINCNELLDFLKPFSDTIDYMRIVRDTFPNQYMTLIKFKTQKDADEFFIHNNNKPFNSIEENVCHLVYVAKIEALNSSKGASLPIPGYIELPNCSICLEKMDEPLNGIITILCNHSFHANCLSKWGDTCCPICRYNQTPDYTMENACSECGAHETLWICLICGHIGCGRYVQGHAFLHFQYTNHNYSMLLGSNKVWDYAADNYVHRLVQNKTDGKLVQFDENGREVQQDEKMESITLEYTYLLTSQLESQRAYYEEKINRMQEKYDLQMSDLEKKTIQTEEENLKLKDNLRHLNKEKSGMEKKCSTMNAKLSKIQAELNEEKELNKCLSSNQEAYQSKLSKLEENLKKLNQEKDSEIENLKSQLSDIMFYLDAQNKISQVENVSKEEIEQSQLVIQHDQAATSSSSAAKSNNRRRKR